MKICDYKGFEIEYNENFYEGFSIKQDFSNIKAKLSEIKEIIDRLVKKDFKRFKLLQNNYEGGYIQVEVSSIGDDGDYWITNEKGHREKRNPDRLYKLNEGNLKKVEEIKKLNSQVSELVNKKYDIEKSLEKEKEELKC